MTNKSKKEFLDNADRSDKYLNEIERRTPEGIRKSIMKQSKANGHTLPTAIKSGGMRAIYQLAKQNVEEFEGVQSASDTKYKTLDDLKAAISRYWDFLIQSANSDEELIADTEGLCQFLGISRKTLQNWERQNHNGFALLIAETRTAIAACNKQIAKKGKMPALVFMADFNNNHEYVQKQQVEIENSQLNQEKMTPEQLKVALDGMEDATVSDDHSPDRFDIEACFVNEDALLGD